MNRKTVEAVHTHTHTHTHQSITKQNWWTVWRERVYNLIDNNKHENALFVIHARDG